MAVFLSISSLSALAGDPYEIDDEDVFTNDDPGDPGGGGHPEDVPLDPGSWILVAAGVGYGVKKWRDAKRKGHKDDAAATTFFLEDDIHKK